MTCSRSSRTVHYERMVRSEATQDYPELLLKKKQVEGNCYEIRITNFCKPASDYFSRLL
jgi:hypothetical protein